MVNIVRPAARRCYVVFGCIGRSLSYRDGSHSVVDNNSVSLACVCVLAGGQYVLATDFLLCIPDSFAPEGGKLPLFIELLTPFAHKQDDHGCGNLICMHVCLQFVFLFRKSPKFCL